MKSIKDAPRDGTKVILHREKGNLIIGRWADKESIFRTGKHWISDNNKYIDVGINRVIGFDEVDFTI